MSEVPHKCNGCGADGVGKLRRWQTPPHPCTGRRGNRTAIDPPPGWGIRFVGPVKLNFCGGCGQRLAKGQLALNGTEVVDKQAERDAATAARRAAAKKEAS